MSTKYSSTIYSEDFVKNIIKLANTYGIKVGYEKGYKKGYTDCFNKVYTTDFAKKKMDDVKNIDSLIEQMNHLLSHTRIEFLEENILKYAPKLFSWEESKMNTLFEKYHFDNRDEIGLFLKQHEYMLEFITLFSTEVERVFGMKTPIKFTKFEDPEGLDKTKILAYIYSDLPYKEIREKTDILNGEWVFKNIVKADGRFNYYVTGNKFF